MAEFSRCVWNRQGAMNEMSEPSYVFAVSGFSVFGIVLATVVAFLTLGWRPSWVSFLLIGFLMPCIGIFLAFGSDNWLVSLFGYILVVGGMGAIIGPTVAFFKSGVVIAAFLATCGTTVVMSIVGIMFPRMLESWGAYLFGALLALLFTRIAQAIMISMGVHESVWYMPWIEYGAAILFSLYIIYDWGRALNLPRTMDNAVDSAVAIFLDMINLFITLLRIFAATSGSSSSNNSSSNN